MSIGRRWELVSRHSLLRTASQLGNSYVVQAKTKQSYKIRTVVRAVDNLPTVAPYHELVGGTRPTDSPVFGPFMKHLIGKQFARDADMNEVVISMLDS